MKDHTGNRTAQQRTERALFTKCNLVEATPLYGAVLCY